MTDQKVDSKRIAVVSGRYPLTKFDSYVNHKAYCDLHGYTYISCSWPTGANNPYMNKIRYIQSYVHAFDYIFWIDDDAFFIDLEQSLEDFLPAETHFLSVCSSPDFKALKTFISSGQFMIRCNAVGKSFLSEVERMDLEAVRDWWKSELGYFSNGDQDAMVFLLKEDEKYKNYTCYNYKYFNSRIENLDNSDRVFILHFTGVPERKQESWLRAQSILRCGSALLPDSVVEKYLKPKAARKKLKSRIAKKIRVALAKILKK